MSIEGSVKIKIDPHKVTQLKEIIQRAFELTVEATLSDIRMSQTVPKNVGTLEESGYTDIDAKGMVASIVFDTPYARRLYWHPEYNFRKDKNPNAQGLWMQTYIDGEKKDFVKNTFSRFLQQLGGGIIK